MVCWGGTIYNRGTWGSGYSTSNLSTYDVASGFSVSISSEASAIKIHSVGNSSLIYNNVSVKLNKAINFSAYKTATFILSGCAGGSWNSHGNWTEHKLFLQSYKYIRRLCSYNLFSGDGYEPKIKEHTVTIDISSLNITGYLCVNFISINESGGLSSSTRYNTSSYIHIIKFT